MHVAMSLYSIDNEASFFYNISMDILCLQVAQLSRSPDMVIFHGAALTDKQIDIHRFAHPLSECLCAYAYYG